MSDEPEDYSEAVAWFNECKARRARDKARIAELEAELHIAEVWRVRAEQAEVELAALKGRRCETCDNLDAYRDGSGNGRCHVRYRRTVMADMSCNRWESRP